MVAPLNYAIIISISYHYGRKKQVFGLGAVDFETIRDGVSFNHSDQPIAPGRKRVGIKAMLIQHGFKAAPGYYQGCCAWWVEHVPLTRHVPVYNGRRRIGLLVFVISMLGAQTESEVDGQCFRDVELLMWRCWSFIITNTWTQIKKMLYVFMYIAI